MASKKLTDEELFAQFEGIGDDTPSAANAAPSKARATSSTTKKPPTSQQQQDDDPLAELENLAKAKPASRPNTPKTLPGRARASDTPGSSNRTSEEGKANAAGTRRSNDSSRSYHQAFTPASTSEGSPEDGDQPTPQAGGGWLGSIWSTASAVGNAARQQAEALAKEVQKNEEAQKWLGEISKGKLDVNALKGLGMCFFICH
ncbi:MAG: maintenance of telomere capping protein 1 [Terriglobus roseus]|nr:maintenance of telomere capping protein 1 [Terriglobus roseus]